MKDWVGGGSTVQRSNDSEMVNGERIKFIGNGTWSLVSARFSFTEQGKPWQKSILLRQSKSDMVERIQNPRSENKDWRTKVGVYRHSIPELEVQPNQRKCPSVCKYASNASC
jgi:hypothetical protein